MERRVLGGVLQGAEQRRLGSGGASAAEVLDGGDGAQGLGAALGVGLGLEAQLEDGDQLLVAGAGAEDGLEDVGGVEPELLAALGDGAGRRDGVVVPGLVLEDQAVLLDGVARALQLGGVEVADGGAQLDARLLGPGGAGLELEVAEQLVPHRLGAVEALQRGEHGGVARGARRARRPGR